MTAVASRRTARRPHRPPGARPLAAALVALWATVVPAVTPALADHLSPRSIDSFCRAMPTSYQPFDDLDTGGAADAVRCLSYARISRGTSDTSFSPTRTITRDQMASLVARMMDRAKGLEYELDPGVRALRAYDGFNRYDDVPSTSVHLDSINRLTADGVVQGVDPGSFAPERDVTRAQVASMLYFAVDSLDLGTPGPCDEATPPTSLPDAFTDDDGNVHECRLNWAADRGILAGDGHALIDPGANATRAQVAAMVVRALAFLEGLIFPLPPPPAPAS